jgi:hypothetical protein
MQEEEYSYIDPTLIKGAVDTVVGVANLAKPTDDGRLRRATCGKKPTIFSSRAKKDEYNRCVQNHLGKEQPQSKTTPQKSDNTKYYIIGGVVVLGIAAIVTTIIVLKRK